MIRGRHVTKNERMKISPMENLTLREAYEAMVQFIQNYYDRAHSEEIAIILSNMSISPREDGNHTGDLAYWDDWLEAVKKVKGDNKLVS